MKWLLTSSGNTTYNPNNSIEDGIAIINELEWSMVLLEGENKRWYVMNPNGENTYFVSDTRSEAEEFIFGMALTLATVPEDVYAEIAKNFRNVHRG